MSGDKSEMEGFLVTSPPQFATAHRTPGIDGLLYVLDSAQKFIYIEVNTFIGSINWIIREICFIGSMFMIQLLYNYFNLGDLKTEISTTELKTFR